MRRKASTAPKSAVSRRRVLTAAGAVGVAATVGSVGGGRVAVAAPIGGTTGRPVSADRIQGPVVVLLRDLSSGTVDVFTGTTRRRVRDRELARRLAMAAQ